MNNSICLSTQEEVQLDKIVSDAERNRKEAQQYAVEAGKLLAATTERLVQYKDRGFFKRCWYAISGKTRELERANVDDLAKMQKFAWAYLMKLQEQNLIEAKSIAVIRNNLKDLQTEMIELHDMIATIVHKFDARVTKLEEVSSLHDWIIHIQAQDGKFAKELPNVCFVQLVFDYYSVLKRNNISFDAVEKRDDLSFALKHFSIDPICEKTLEDFISGLAREVLSFGFDQFKQIVEMNVGEKAVSCQEILDNVAGTGYNALYTFVQEMEKMQNVLKFIEKEKVGDIMRKTVLSSLNNVTIKYTAIELGQEILGGSLILQDVFSPSCGYPENEIAQTAAGTLGFDIESLLGGYVSLSAHSFLDTNPSQEEKQLYVESFALIYAGIGAHPDSNYLSSVARLFNCESSMERVRLLAMSPQRVDVPAIIRTLAASEMRRYIWCVDAMFVGQENGDVNPRVKSVVLSMCKALGLAENLMTQFLDDVNLLVSGKEPEAIFLAIKKISRTTDAWKSIVDFKRISLKGMFADLSERLSNASGELLKLSFGLIQVQMDGVSFDFDKSAYETVRDRDRRLGKFNAFKAKTQELLSSFENLLKDANEVRRMFGTPYIECPLDVSGIECDPATQIENENWDENFHNAIDRLNAAIEKTSTGLEIFNEQISLYKEGRYAETAVGNREKVRMAAEAKRQAEEAAKQTVGLELFGRKVRLHPRFKAIEDLPFDHTDVRGLEWFDGKWYALAGKLWKSSEGEQWEEARLPETLECYDSIAVVNSTLIVYDSWGKAFAFTSDGVNWFFAAFPDDLHDKRLYYHNGRWLLYSQNNVEYKYMKNGSIFTPEETGYCNQTMFYETGMLSQGEWQEVRELALRRGHFIKPGSLFSVDGCRLIALSSVDTFYMENMHIENHGIELLYAQEGKGWLAASCDRDALMSYGDSRATNEDARFTKFCGRLICVANKHVFTSKDGKSWQVLPVGLNVGGSSAFVNIGNLLLLKNWNDEIYLTPDGENFSVLKIGHEPDYIASNDHVALICASDRNVGGLFTMELVDDNEKASF